MTWRPCEERPSTSSSVMRIRSRRDMPARYPRRRSRHGSEDVALEQLGGDRAVDPRAAPRPPARARGPDDAVDQVERARSRRRRPTGRRRARPGARRPSHMRCGQQATDAADQPHGDAGVAGHRGRRPRPAHGQELGRGRWPATRAAPGRWRPPPRRGPAGGRRWPRRRPATAGSRTPRPRRRVSTASTSTSPRRGSASPISSGQPSTVTGASSGRAWASSAAGGVGLDLAGGHPDLVGRVAGGEHPGGRTTAAGPRSAGATRCAGRP